MAIGSDLDFKQLYAKLQAPVTEFDCGQLCAPSNGGKPVCCTGDSTIPVLYQGELKLLLERTDLWSKWVPESEEDREIEEEMGHFSLAVCRGVEHCERDNRSLNCRTFPFMPYFDHDEVLAGIVYDLEAAEEKCPLVALPGVVTGRYITESLDFWQTLVDGDDREADFYLEESAGLRKLMGRREQPVQVLTIDGVREYPTRRKDWKKLMKKEKEPRLIAMIRPKG